MLVPCPQTTYYIDPDRTSRESGQGNVTPSRPRHLPVDLITCCSSRRIAETARRAWSWSRALPSRCRPCDRLDGLLRFDSARIKNLPRFHSFPSEWHDFIFLYIYVYSPSPKKSIHVSILELRSQYASCLFFNTNEIPIASYNQRAIGPCSSRSRLYLL